jgi:DNA-binding FadR family transcriptional regulator
MTIDTAIIMRTILECSGVRARIIHYIMSHLTAEGHFLGSLQSIASDIGCSRASVRSAIAAMTRDKTCLYIKRNVYRLQINTIAPQNVDVSRMDN